MERMRYCDSSCWREWVDARSRCTVAIGWVPRETELGQTSLTEGTRMRCRLNYALHV